MKITKRQLRRIIKEQMAIVDVPKDIQDRIAKIQDPLDREALEDGADEVLGGERDLSDLEGWLEDIESGGGHEAMEERKTSHMKVVKRQLRRIIREAIAAPPTPTRGTGLGDPTPEAWADHNDLPLEFDNEGQKIIYLDNEQADRLDMPPGVKWDAQRDQATDGWIIYTGEYQ